MNLHALRPAVTRSAATVRRSNSLFCLVATAALSTTLTGTHPAAAYAFSVTPRPSLHLTPRRSRTEPTIIPHQQTHLTPRQQRYSSISSRCYFASPLRNNNDNRQDEKPKGIFGKLGKALTSVFGSSEERKEKAAALERKREVKNQVNDGVDEMLRGAPLGVRMLGKMLVKPLMGSLASNLAEGMAAQAKTMEQILEDAQRLIMNDAAVVDALGTPIQIGTPFSQSSSMVTVNGQTQSRIELAMNVAGTKRNGVARVMANGESGVSQLIVEAGGRVFNVNVSSSSSSSGAAKKMSSFSSDDIIDAEIIVDKDTKK